MYYIALSIIKIVDSMLTTGRTILLQKNKALISSVLLFFSQIIFYFVVSEVIKDKNTIVIFIIAFSSAFGNYLMSFVNNKVSKDKLYVNFITTTNISNMKNFGDYCRKNKIKIITTKSYDYNLVGTLTAMVFCKTKEESKKIDSYLIKNPNINFFREITY